MGLVSLALVALAMALGADSSFAMAEVTPTGTAPTADTAGGANIDPVGGTADTKGLETQYQGQGATAGEARQQGLEVDEIDQIVAKFRPFKFPLEWFITNRMQQQTVKSYKQTHYRSGATPLEATIGETAVVSTGEFVKKNVTLTFGYNSFEKGMEYIHEYDVLYVSSVAGYNEDGTTEEGGLRLYVTKADEDGIRCLVMNPPATGKVTIPENTKLIVIGNACSESQMIVDPETYLPVPCELYLQKKISNVVMTKEWIEQARKVKFITADVVDNALYNHKRKCARAHWLGGKFMTNIKVTDAKIGQEAVYFEKGILSQINMSYAHSGDEYQYEDFIALSQMMHTDNAANTNSVALCGKNAVRRLQLFFLKNTEFQKSVTFEHIDEIGVDLYKWHDAFGTMEFIHDPTLNDIEMEDFIVLLDMENAVHYVKKMEQEKKQDLEKNGENREAERRIITTIDCVGLKGYNSVIFGPASLAGRMRGLGGVSVFAKAANALPQSPTNGTVIYLTDAVEGFEAGTLVKWDGTAWVEYEGVIEA